MLSDGKRYEVNSCANGHNGIVFGGKKCPLCEAIQIIEKLMDPQYKNKGSIGREFIQKIRRNYNGL